jgi:hypothetical protein
MVTPDEQRAIQEKNAEDGERFWDAMLDIGASSVEGHKALIARAEAVIAKEGPRVAEAAEKVEAAKSRLEKLKRGEDVAGGLGKPFDVRAALKAEGFAERDLRRCELLASLTKAEFATLCEQTRTKELDAIRKVVEREARRIIQTRT